MQIELFEPIDSDYKKLYLNKETRYPTVTDVQFLQDDLIIVAQDQDGGFLYTGEVNNNKISEIKKYLLKAFHTELLFIKIF
jgi:hypothetical protein